MGSKSRIAFFLGCVTALAGSLFSQTEESDPFRPPTEINFGHEAKYGRYFPFNEIKSWAVSRNLVVLEDCNLRDIRDDEAEIVPTDGMNFQLATAGSGRVYLYLDMVVFRPADQYNPLLDGIHCKPGPDRVQIDSKRMTDLKQVRWISIEVGGKVLHTAYVGGDTFLRSPIVVPVDREYVQDGKLDVRLRTSPGDGFFAIWDTFVSKSPDG